MTSRPGTRLHHEESGLSLVELLVGMFVLGIIMSSVLSTAVTSQQVIRTNSQRLVDAETARLSIDASSKQLRSAVRISPTDPIFDIAQPDLVRFQAFLGTEPIQVELAALPDGRFVERHWTPDPASDPPTYSGVPRERVLANDLDPSTYASVFRFIDADRCVVDPAVCPPLDATASSTTGLASSDLDTVDLVTVELVVQGEVNPPTDPYTVTTTVRIRNESYVPETP